MTDDDTDVYEGPVIVGTCKCGGYGVVFNEEAEREAGRCHMPIDEVGHEWHVWPQWGTGGPYYVGCACGWKGREPGYETALQARQAHAGHLTQVKTRKGGKG